MAQQYQVLARKWRPQQFDGVVGQEHVTTTLKNAIEQHRLAHAYLFVGPRGIGKTSTARIFAKALNCVKGPTITPCDKCDNCKEIAEGRSLDVLEIDGASNRGIDEVRELRDTVRYAPAHSKFKLYIIDEVHMLTKEAFNALLKTLEEPPAHVKFLFATTEPQKVLPTILSRCQRFDLRRIPANLIVKHLREIAKTEKVSIDDEALAAIARGAEGGLRDAESTLDQLIAFCGNKIAESDVLSVFGLVAHDQIAELTNAIVDGQTTRALKVLKDLDDIGKDLQRLAADLLDHFRNLLVVTLGEEGSAPLPLPDTEMELLKAQAKRTDSDAVLRIIDALAAAEGRLRYALSKRVFFEIALVKAVKARDMVGIDGLLKKVNELKASLGGAPSVGPASAKIAAAHEKPAPNHGHSPASLEEAWQSAVEHLGKVVPLAKMYLVGTRPLGLKGNVLVVGFDPEFVDRKEFADRPRNIEVLQAKLKEKLRMDVALKFQAAELASVPPRAPVPPPAKPAVAGKAVEPVKKDLDDFKNDPLIKKALEIFKGTIVEVRK
jgi:DNA polymerase-3 subunit gamma/tau